MPLGDILALNNDGQARGLTRYELLLRASRRGQRVGAARRGFVVEVPGLHRTTRKNGRVLRRARDDNIGPIARRSH